MIPIQNPKSHLASLLEALPLSLLNDFLYCNRRAALKVVEGWRSANQHTARGDIVHEHADLRGYEVLQGVKLLRALPVFSDRLAVTLINRQQIASEHFVEREGGAVEFSDTGRKLVIKAYQERKQETLKHPLLDQNLRLAQMPYIQARILARHLRGDILDYVPLVPK